MMIADRDAWACDLAETYGILDYRSLPVSTLAVLSAGLREDSRIKMELEGAKQDLNTLLQAGIFDRLSTLVWAKTKDAEHGRNRPKSVVSTLLGTEKQHKEKPEGFSTPEEFEAKRKSLLKKEQ